MVRFISLLSILTTMFLAACGGGYSGYHLPVETELKPFRAAEAEDLSPEEEGWDLEEEDQAEPEESAEPAAEPSGAAAPEPAPAPAAKASAPKTTK